MAQPNIVNIVPISICFAHLHQTFPVFYLKKTMLRSFLLSMMDLVCLQYSIRSITSNSYSTICTLYDYHNISNYGFGVFTVALGKKKTVTATVPYVYA